MEHIPEARISLSGLTANRLTCYNAYGNNHENVPVVYSVFSLTSWSSSIAQKNIVCCNSTFENRILSLLDSVCAGVVEWQTQRT